jgi:choline dehydrogenase
MEPADWVIAGGGSAGCVIAARLSEDASLKVALLEAGPPDRDIWIHLPAGYARLFGSGKYDWRYETAPEPNLNDRRLHWPRGRVLGGSGSVNGLVFLRGSPGDFDRWAQAGARGWSWEEVAPVFRRMESWHGPPHPERGTSGPIQVTAPCRLAPSAEAFLQACEAAGFKRHPDVNNGTPIDGAGPIQLNVGPDGRRSYSARTYLKPAMKRPNLAVRTGLLATKVVVEGGRATGVLTRDAATGEEVFHPARRGVVVSAGAIETPKLLMLSGIGDGATLQAMGIPVTRHSPGVGRNLQDHLIAKLIWRTKPCGTMNEILGSRLHQARVGLEYLLRRSGPLAVGAGEANLFARATPGAEEAELQFMFINFSTYNYLEGLHRFPGVMLNYGTCRPDSRGEVLLASPDPIDKPVVRANYLDHPNDVRLMLEGARMGRRIAAQRPFADLLEEELRPGPAAQDDEAILENIRATATSVFHPCGTARMGSDDLAVLDPELRLRGVEGLRVADASAFPLIPSPNIQPSVLMLAERAAEFIRRG